MGSLFGINGLGPSSTFGLINGHPLLSGVGTNKVQAAFITTLSRIELDQTRIERASQHYNAIKQWLENKLPVQVRQVGSFQRSTKIRPSASGTLQPSIDIDALVCWGDATHFSSYGDGLNGLDALRSVRDALASNATYKTLAPQIDSPVVIVSYANEFSVELIPCYRNRMQPHGWLRTPASYLVSNRNGAWEPADYDYDSEYITQANKSSYGKLVPAIKLIKRFIHNKGIPLKSFQIELLCVRLLIPYLTTLNEQHISWDWKNVLSFFLNLAPQFLQQSLSLPGSLSQASYVDRPTDVAAALLSWATICDDLNRLPDSEKTLQLWGQFFGDPFPAS